MNNEWHMVTEVKPPASRRVWVKAEPKNAKDKRSVGYVELWDSYIPFKKSWKVCNTGLRVVAWRYER